MPKIIEPVPTSKSRDPIVGLGILDALISWISVNLIGLPLNSVVSLSIITNCPF
jgi:hypothetical protein